MPVRLLAAVAVFGLATATVVKTTNPVQRAFPPRPLDLAADVAQSPDADVLTPASEPPSRRICTPASVHTGRRKVPNPVVAPGELGATVTRISLPPPRGA